MITETEVRATGMKNSYVESYNGVFHFYHIRENKCRRWEWIEVGYRLVDLVGFRVSGTATARRHLREGP